MSKRKKLFFVLTVLSALYFVVTHFLINMSLRPHQEHLSQNAYMWWYGSTVVSALACVYSYYMYDDAY